jgi:hypothetical protein
MRLPYQEMTGTSRRVHPSGAGDGITPSACVGATVQRGRACLRLPVSLPFIGRSVCLPAPGVPNLGRVSGCCDLRKKWGIPTGVRCCLRFRGSEILCKSFP